MNLLGPEARAHLDEHIGEAEEAGMILNVSGPVLDFGSGGGLPAIPMAIQAGEMARFHLVESDAKKWAFLKFVARECQLNCIVHGDRLQRVLEALDPDLRFDLITSRAVGYPEQWLPLVRKRLNARGRVALFQSGPKPPVIPDFTTGAVHRLSRGDDNFLVILRCST